MIRRCFFLGLVWAAGGCTANAGGSPGEPDTADAVAESTSPDNGASSASPANATTSADSDHVNSLDDVEGTAGASATSTSESDVNASAGQSLDAGDVVSCDVRKVLCKRAEPTCDYGYVPRIVDGCYADCVRVDECVCNGPDACPQNERYTCNNSRQRCTPYLH